MKKYLMFFMTLLVVVCFASAAMADYDTEDEAIVLSGATGTDSITIDAVAVITPTITISYNADTLYFELSADDFSVDSGYFLNNGSSEVRCAKDSFEINCGTITNVDLKIEATELYNTAATDRMDETWIAVHTTSLNDWNAVSSANDAKVDLTGVGTTPTLIHTYPNIGVGLSTVYLYGRAVGNGNEPAAEYTAEVTVTIGLDLT